jgi:hypothetical protein
VAEGASEKHGAEGSQRAEMGLHVTTSRARAVRCVRPLEPVVRLAEGAEGSAARGAGARQAERDFYKIMGYRDLWTLEAAPDEGWSVDEELQIAVDEGRLAAQHAHDSRRNLTLRARANPQKQHFGRVSMPASAAHRGRSQLQSSS